MLDLYEHININGLDFLKDDKLLFRKFDLRCTYDEVIKIKRANKASKSNSIEEILSRNTPGKLLNLIFQSWAENKLPIICKDQLKKEAAKQIKNFYRPPSKNYINKENEIQDHSPIVLFTSGSTSQPKPYVITWKNIKAHVNSITQIIKFNSESHYGLCLPKHHLSGLMPLFRIFFNGGTLEEIDLKSPKPSFKNITHISLVNAQISTIIDHKNEFKNLSNILIGGGLISKKLINKLEQCHFLNIFTSYGLSEMTSTVTLKKVKKVKELDKDPFITNLGIPIPGVEIKRDASYRILIKGDSCFEGYLLNGKLEKSLDSDGFFQTNDIGEIKNNELIYKGRSDDIFISGGKNVSLSHVQNIISKFNKIINFQLTKLPHQKWGETLAMIYSAVDDDVGENLDEFLKKNLQSEEIPKVILRSEKILLTGIKITSKDILKLIEKPPVIFLHGQFGHGSDWEKLIFNWKERFYTINIDPPKEDMSFNDGIKFIHDKIQNLNTPPSTIVGYSLGGRIAAFLKKMYPHHYQKTVIISSNLFELKSMEDRTNRTKSDKVLLNGINTNEDYKNFLTKWYSTDLFKGSLDNNFIKEKINNLNINDLERQKRLLKIFSQGKQSDLTDWIKDQKSNIIYLHGEKDEKYSEVAIKIKNINRDSTTHRFTGAYHNCHVSNQKDFNKIIDKL